MLRRTLLLFGFLLPAAFILWMSTLGQALSAGEGYAVPEPPAATESPAATAPSPEDKPFVPPSETEPAPEDTPEPWPYPEPVPVLVNRDHPLDKSYVPEDLVNIGSTYFEATPETAEATLVLLDAARAEGVKDLVLKSGYRSYATQRVLHERKINQLKPTYGERAAEEAAGIVVPPGASEHQLGLAVDIAANGRLVLSFGGTDSGRWLAENAHRFGFILRYPGDKTDITGVIYEPWHLRYVGEETARAIYESGLCLEEYVALYENREQK